MQGEKVKRKILNIMMYLHVRRPSFSLVTWIGTFGGGTYPAIDHIHINVSLFSPLVPEIGVIQRNVCAVSGRHKTGLKADITITLHP